MRRWSPTRRSDFRLEKRPTSLRPPDKPLLPQRLRACQGRMSPDAVWQYGCAAKSAEPVSIQAPHHWAARSLRKRGPFQAAEAALRLVQTNRADSVGCCLPSRPLIGRLSPNTDDFDRWCRREETLRLSLSSSLLLPLTYILFPLCSGKTASFSEISMPVVNRIFACFGRRMFTLG